MKHTRRQVGTKKNENVTLSLSKGDGIVMVRQAHHDRKVFSSEKLMNSTLNSDFSGSE